MRVIFFLMNLAWGDFFEANPKSDPFDHVSSYAFDLVNATRFIHKKIYEHPARTLSYIGYEL